MKHRDGDTPVVTQAGVERLLHMVADVTSGCREKALRRIHLAGLGTLYPYLEKAMRDDNDADARNGAMEALVGFGADAVPALVRLLRDDNEEIRNLTTVVLGNIGCPEAVVPLIEALRDPDVNVRQGAAEALGKIGDKKACGPMIGLLSDDFWVKYTVVDALGSMGDERAIPYLQDMLSDPLCSDRARIALDKLSAR
jgi:HEAT repeat protein